MSAVKEIEIDGKKYPVRYDLNAICEFEDLTGKSLLAGDMKEGLRDPKALRALVFVGLKCGHRYANGKDVKFEMDIEDVGSLLGLVDGTFTKFMDAFNGSLGKPTENAAGAPVGMGDEPPGESA